MAPRKRFIIVFVVDGLRPDAITAEDTPTLHRLRAEGVDFANSHAALPTVTRVNAAAIATGTQPGTNGIVGNQIYVPAVDSRRALDTGNVRNLIRVDEVTAGQLLLAPTLAERLQAQGLRLVGVSSGSTGSAFLLNPRAPAGVGALVNGYLDPGRTVGYPADVSAAVLAKFGPAPPKTGADRYDEPVAWTQRVLREYVLPELAPDVVINWLTEPDHSQHTRGVGSPAARAALRHDDAEIARVLAAMDALGLIAAADVFVVSDHGFTTNTAGVDVARELIDAGLKAAADSADVVLASSGQSVGLHVEGQAREHIAAIARFVQSREWGGVVFTEGRAPGDPHGVVEGTFSLELIHLAHPGRGPDLLLTFPWSSRPNAFGVPGSDLANVSGGAAPYFSDHGSMSPWNIRNTGLAGGVDFKKGVTVRTPTGNVDVAPTILSLLGLGEAGGLDGRVLAEAIEGGPDPEQMAVETRVHMVEAAAYRAAVQVSTVAGHRYVDKSWRIL
ncbi:MAG TPA: nucleotide pyrophosphatase/phosphodiesterase family protein [Pseudomonadales bacterium]|nr:nucleotide pyrophosphatase/phosphodiesterase family protein [Pseudomonadales bacterium]